MFSHERFARNCRQPAGACMAFRRQNVSTAGIMWFVATKVVQYFAHVGLRNNLIRFKTRKLSSFSDNSQFKHKNILTVFDYFQFWLRKCCLKHYCLMRHEGFWEVHGLLIKNQCFLSIFWHISTCIASEQNPTSPQLLISIESLKGNILPISEAIWIFQRKTKQSINNQHHYLGNSY